MEEPTNLARIAGPPHIAGRRAGPLVGDQHARHVLSDKIGVPQVLCRQAGDDRVFVEGKILRRCGDPIEESPPDILRLLLVQSWDTIVTARILPWRKATLSPQ